LGPAFGFLCLSKLSRVEEFVSTSSTWNLKNMVITTKKAIWIRRPTVWMMKLTEMACLLLRRAITYWTKRGI